MLEVDLRCLSDTPQQCLVLWGDFRHAQHCTNRLLVELTIQASDRRIEESRRECGHTLERQNHAVIPMEGTEYLVIDFVSVARCNAELAANNFTETNGGRCLAHSLLL